jgi:dTDP-4-dehydrorhamnose 3,5-epimerase
MQRITTFFPDVFGLISKRYVDMRGYFCETYRATHFAEQGITHPFVQDNQSFSAKRGTVRGLHFQRSPMAQAKLVSVQRGAILDVVLDVRPESATYGQHISIKLSADNGMLLYIPAGYAHGFCTLTDDCLVSYKCSNIYSPTHEAGVLWCDPALDIQWGIAKNDAVLSDRDTLWPVFSQVQA